MSRRTQQKRELESMKEALEGKVSRLDQLEVGDPNSCLCSFGFKFLKLASMSSPISIETIASLLIFKQHNL